VAAEYYHTGAGAYITRPPLSLPTGISVNLRLLGVTGRTETRLYMRVPLRRAGVGARTRARRWDGRTEGRGGGAAGRKGFGDGRKNDGHKYRSYLCFMTVRPRYRQEESARIRGKAPTIDSQILTDVLAQWIPVSPGAASASRALSLSLSLSLFFSHTLSMEGGGLVSDRRRALQPLQRCERRSESSISPLRSGGKRKRLPMCIRLSNKFAFYCFYSVREF